MQRPQARGGESRVLLLIVAILVCLAARYGLLHLQGEMNKPVSAVDRLNAAIREVDGAVVAQVLGEFNRTGLPGKLEGDQHPLYTLTVIPEEETQEAKTIVRTVAQAFCAAPFPLDVAHHPLTMAYHHNKLTVARILLEVQRGSAPAHETPMTEVYCEVLSPAQLRSVDASVSVFCSSLSDCQRCERIVGAERLRGISRSLIAGAHVGRHGVEPNVTQEMLMVVQSYTPERVVAPGSTVRAGFWSDPFRPPLPNVLPPHGATVMNPGYFSSALEQEMYTIYGVLTPTPLMMGFVFYALVVTGICCTSWIVGVVAWMLCYR